LAGARPSGDLARARLASLAPGAGITVTCTSTEPGRRISADSGWQARVFNLTVAS
jgi:hypothetical protein